MKLFFSFFCLLCLSSCKVSHDVVSKGKGRAIIVVNDTVDIFHDGQVKFPRK